MNNLKILYEDNHIIVVFKPSNVLSQGDATRDIDMLTIIKKYIKEKYNKPGNVYLGLVHRLDRPVQGIMVFAKSSKAASRLFKDIKEHRFHKTYLAVVRGIIPKKEGELVDYLIKDSDGNTKVVNENIGKKSVLKYKVIDEKDNYSLVEIELLTGRHHQIRVQFASRGYPLVGDNRYGSLDKKQICLCSYKLSFTHPVTKEIMNFTLYPEKNNECWDLFL